MKQRRSRIVKISKKTFNRKVDKLKTKLKENKISIGKYRSTVWKYRSHMTIDFTTYQTRIQWITSQWKLGKITQQEYESS